MKFFFTYGSEGQPFYGGWTEVEAPDRESAIQAFRAYHPDQSDGFVNCGSIYEERDFVTTSMFKNGNFGYRCHERIILFRQVMNASEDAQK